MTQIVVRLAVASAVEWDAEMCRLVRMLEAEIAAGGNESCCVNPSALHALTKVLLDADEEAAQAASCRVLNRLLTNDRSARRLFLTEVNGASALLGAATPHGNSIND